MSNWSSPRAWLVVARPAASFTMRRAGCTHASSHCLVARRPLHAGCRCPLNSTSPICSFGFFQQGASPLDDLGCQDALLRVKVRTRLVCAEAGEQQAHVNRGLIGQRLGIEMAASCGARVQMGGPCKGLMPTTGTGRVAGGRTSSAGRTQLAPRDKRSSRRATNQDNSAAAPCCAAAAPAAGTAAAAAAERSKSSSSSTHL